MQVRFLGATETVTGSKYLLEHRGERVLVDCGLFQGYKQLRLRNWSPLPVQPPALRSVVLTHAHLDHSGYLPLLVRAGFHGAVHCTQPTADLCAILLPDSGHLLEEEANYNNRHGTSKHHPALPLYTRDDAVRSLQALRPVRPDAEWEAAAGLVGRFFPVGHMPGASSARLDDGNRSILFSGDLGRRDDLLLKPPSPPPAADYLVQ